MRYLLIFEWRVRCLQLLLLFTAVTAPAADFTFIGEGACQDAAGHYPKLWIKAGFPSEQASQDACKATTACIGYRYGVSGSYSKQCGLSFPAQGTPARPAGWNDLNSEYTGLGIITQADGNTLLECHAKQLIMSGTLARFVVIDSVKIMHDDFGRVINLAEVQSFGTSGNLLTPVKATLSSTHEQQNVGAGQCIDGINTNVCHSGVGDKDPKLTIDYGRQVAMSLLVVKNRVGGDGRLDHGDRIVGARISIQNDRNQVAWSSTF